MLAGQQQEHPTCALRDNLYYKWLQNKYVLPVHTINLPFCQLPFFCFWWLREEGAETGSDISQMISL